MRIISTLLLLISVAPSYAGQPVPAKASEQMSLRGLADSPASQPDMVVVAPQRYWAVIRCASKADRSRVAEIGMDVSEVGEGTAAGPVTKDTLDALERAGFKVQFKTKLSTYLRPSRDFPP
ncbi:MAG TPA: hypothetical protein PLL10_05970, partial [Elusimicrobiales bacterium]|nr:hypothetical protein [Elusimicrobiales bacterium]